MSRIQSTLFATAFLLAGGMLLTACPQGDVGAPCNHGSVEAPSSKLVTFPALSCSDLLCVYGEEKTVPQTGCSVDDECNAAGGQNIFDCVNGSCKLSLDYVLERSMCSKTCETNDDCNNTSLNNRPAVDDDETACATGFSCTVLQRLGQFCCQRLCVCNDDLDTLDDLEADCQPNVGEAWKDCFGSDAMTTGG
ncbi:MAG: hypothetical protein R6X02_28920 [Enhygromyxa sp.]